MEDVSPFRLLTTPLCSETPPTPFPAAWAMGTLDYLWRGLGVFQQEELPVSWEGEGQAMGSVLQPAFLGLPTVVYSTHHRLPSADNCTQKGHQPKRYCPRHLVMLSGGDSGMPNLDGGSRVV